MQKPKIVLAEDLIEQLENLKDPEEIEKIHFQISSIYFSVFAYCLEEKKEFKKLSWEERPTWLMVNYKLFATKDALKKWAKDITKYKKDTRKKEALKMSIQGAKEYLGEN